MTGKIIIHCVRHAQGFHNLSTENHQIPDPLLTPLGLTQCASLASSFPNPSNLTHIVASPLRRTLYTALYSFPSLFTSPPRPGFQILGLPEIQETGALPCNTGSDPSLLATEFGPDGTSDGRGKVDLHLVHEGWNSNLGPWISTPSALHARALAARRFLLKSGKEALAKGEVNANGDVEMAVVTHGGFLHFFTQDWEGWGVYNGTGWKNIETRNFEFLAVTTEEEGQGVDGNAGIKERDVSRRARGAETAVLGKEDQNALRLQAMERWEACGYQDPEVKDGELEGGEGRVGDVGTDGLEAKLLEKESEREAILVR